MIDTIEFIFGSFMVLFDSSFYLVPLVFSAFMLLLNIVMEARKL